MAWTSVRHTPLLTNEFFLQAEQPPCHRRDFLLAFFLKENIRSLSLSLSPPLSLSLSCSRFDFGLLRFACRLLRFDSVLLRFASVLLRFEVFIYKIVVCVAKNQSEIIKNYNLHA